MSRADRVTKQLLGSGQWGGTRRALEEGIRASLRSSLRASASNRCHFGAVEPFHHRSPCPSFSSALNSMRDQLSCGLQPFAQRVWFSRSWVRSPLSSILARWTARRPLSLAAPSPSPNHKPSSPDLGGFFLAVGTRLNFPTQAWREHGKPVLVSPPANG